MDDADARRAARRRRDELVFARSSPEAKLRIADALRAQRRRRGDDRRRRERRPGAAARRHRRRDGALAAPTSRARRRRWCSPTTTSRPSSPRSRRAAGSTTTSASSSSTSSPTPRPRSSRSWSSRCPAAPIPLPLTVLQILAIDLGTETLPALALGREPAEPGLMDRPPRPRARGRHHAASCCSAPGACLGRASRPSLVLGGFFCVPAAARAGRPGDPTGAGHAAAPRLPAGDDDDLRRHRRLPDRHRVRRRAPTARRCARSASSRNRLLLWGIAFELVFAALLIYVPALQDVFGTAALPASALLVLVPFPFIVWGADELRRFRRRRSPVVAAGPADAVDQTAI